MPVRSKWQSLPTEAINPHTLAIDKLAPVDIVEGMLNEDRKMLAAVQREKERIAVGVEIITQALRKGGRIVFVGAGTSGRLGILEAAEMPVTFGTDADLVQAIMAGGKNAIFRSRNTSASLFVRSDSKIEPPNPCIQMIAVFARRGSNQRPLSRRPSVASKRTSSVYGTAPHDLAARRIPSPDALARQVRASEPEAGVVQLDEVRFPVEDVLSRRREGEERLRRLLAFDFVDRDHRDRARRKAAQIPQKFAVA